MLSEKFEKNENNMKEHTEEEYKDMNQHRNKRKFIPELNNLMESSDVIIYNF